MGNLSLLLETAMFAAFVELTCRTDIIGDGRTSTKSIGLELRNTSDESGSHQSGCWQRTCLRYLFQGLFWNLGNLRRCLARISEVKLRINVSTLRLTEKYSVSEVASIISFETVSTSNEQFCSCSTVYEISSIDVRHSVPYQQS